jgi:xylulokinase
MPFYLGFDSSTQSLTATVIDGDLRRVVFQHSVMFDRDLPHYGTANGVKRHAGSLVVTSPPLMWVEALDLMMGILSRQTSFDRSQIAAIGGCAQQHGTVYLNASFAAALQRLDPSQPLAGQIAGVFSRQESPVWMDESTAPQCAAIARVLGGDDAVARLTGSRPFARFAGPQIKKFAAESPEAYAATDRIDLVSSFMASLLVGRAAPIEPGDGAGMNLMDIRTRRWDRAALDATAPDLAARLPAIEESATAIGVLSRYWQSRYGLPPARLVPWTGDNPSSLVGAGLVHEGDVGISLGTSDTVFGPVAEPPAQPGGANVFGSPAGGYMLLVCFRNGSLAREHIRNQYGLDWAGFSRALSAAAPDPNGGVMLPWVEAEITPTIASGGVRRFGLSPDDGPANVRALVQGQMMAMANHWSALSGGAAGRIRATGGASQNREILQVMADVFGADVYAAGNANAASLGSALRAFHADRSRGGADGAVAWRDVVAGFTEDDGPPVRARPEHVAIYARLRRRYAELEAREAASG